MSASIEIDVECVLCGSPLEAEVVNGRGSRASIPRLKVEPCGTCMKSAAEKAVEEASE